MERLTTFLLKPIAMRIICRPTFRRNRRSAFLRKSDFQKVDLESLTQQVRARQSQARGRRRNQTLIGVRRSSIRMGHSMGSLESGLFWGPGNAALTKPINSDKRRLFRSGMMAPGYKRELLTRRLALDTCCASKWGLN